MVWLGNMFDCQSPVKNKKIYLPYLPSSLHLSILNIAKFLSFWMVEVKILYKLEML